LYHNNAKYIQVLFAFSKGYKYKVLPEITPKTVSHRKSRKKIQSSEKIMQTQVKFISFILPVLSIVSYELQNLFSTFDVARNDFFRENI